MKNRPDDELPLRFLPWEAAIIHTHLRYIAQGDTLIRRKCGDAIFDESRRRAEDVLKAGGCRTVTGQQELTQFDAWLRADGHRRNPGTSADLVAASLFWCLRKNWIVSPTKDDLLLHAEAIRSASCPALQSRQ